MSIATEYDRPSITCWKSAEATVNKPTGGGEGALERGCGKSEWSGSPYLWGAVEAALDVRVHALVGAARGAEVDHLDARALGVPQQNVLRLEVTVDDIHLRGEARHKDMRKTCQLLHHGSHVLRQGSIRRDMSDGGIESGRKWSGSF